MALFRALALAAAPVALATTVAPSALHAQQRGGLAQVQAHLKAVDTMTANFTQSGRRGQTLNGTLALKRPGKIRFDYGRGANMLVVGDGRALTFIDNDVNQRQRWPINDSPLSVLLNPNQDLARFARVVQDNATSLLIEARDPRRPEFGRITVGFTKSASAPAGLILTGWNVVDAQNNYTQVRLSGQRFNVPVADSQFRVPAAPARGPRG